MNEFGLKLILVLVAVALIFLVFNYFIRKLLKVEKKPWFSYNHVNNLHKKIDWAIRISSVIVIIASTYFRIYEESLAFPWYFEIWFILIVFIVLSESVRAFMDWKYDTNPKTYILTLSEMVLVIVLIVLVVNWSYLLF